MQAQTRMKKAKAFGLLGFDGTLAVREMDHVPDGCWFDPL